MIAFLTPQDKHDEGGETNAPTCCQAGLDPVSTAVNPQAGMDQRPVRRLSRVEAQSCRERCEPRKPRALPLVSSRFYITTIITYPSTMVPALLV